MKMPTREPVKYADVVKALKRSGEETFSRSLQRAIVRAFQRKARPELKPI
jgi:hypothetical protein